MTWRKKKCKVQRGKRGLNKMYYEDMDRERFVMITSNNYRRYHGKRPIRSVQISKTLHREYFRITKKDKQLWKEMMECLN